MKKQFLSCILMLLVATAALNSTSAQTTAMLSGNHAYPNTGFAYKSTDIANLENTLANNALPPTAVSLKALKSFDKSFKNVSTPAEWYAVGKKSYLATFTAKDGRASRVLFTKNGGIYYIISYGDEGSLSKAERRTIKSNYVDYTIGRVSEVSSGGQKVKVVNLQDDENLVILRITEEGDLDELEHHPLRAKEKQRKGHLTISKINN